MKWMSTGSVCVAAVVAAVLAVSSARLAAGGGQQGDDVRRRTEALEAGQKEILKQLQELKALLQQGRPPAPPAQAAPPPLPSEPIGLEGSVTRGNVNAKVTIVEFSDFQCPFCGRFARETFAQLDHDYVATGKVRYVFRNFPLERIHPNAFKAALAGECARPQGKFWELHDRMFANQQALADLNLLNYAKAVGIDGAAFQRCVTGPVAAKVRQDLDEGARAGITGTPTFFIGVVQKDGRLKALKKVPGAAPYATFRSAIDTLLASSPS